MKKRIILIFFSLLLILAGWLAVSSTRTAFAQAPAAPQQPQAKPTPSDDDVNRVARQLFCPVCENIPLDVCPTQACHDWRELIRQKLGDGWSDQQIKDYFAQQYGDRVLAEPPRRGLNWLVYLLPPVAIVVGGGIVWRVLSSMRKNASAGSAAGPGAANTTPLTPSDDPYMARLEEELKKKE